LTIENNRSIGKIGGILTLFGAIGTALNLVRLTGDYTTPVGLADLGILGIASVVSLLAFVGFVLFMVAMHGFSKDYGEHRIFSYLLNGFIATIVIAIIIMAAWFALTVTSIFTSISGLNGSGPTSSTQIQSALSPYLASLMLAISIATIVWIFANYKAFNLLADKSEVQDFRTTAKLFLLGAILNITIAVAVVAAGYFSAIDYNTLLIVTLPGNLIQYVGWAFAVKGFSSIEAPPQTATSPPNYVSMPNSAVKYCSHCGAPTPADAKFCIRCGQKQ